MEKEKCLCSEAREKCQCESCIQFRKIREQMIEQQLRWETYKIWRDCFENAIKEKDT